MKKTVIVHYLFKIFSGIVKTLTQTQLKLGLTKKKLHIPLPTQQPHPLHKLNIAYV